MPLGILRTVVPAAPDAWITALSDYGTMTFGDVARRRDPLRPRRLRRVRVHGDHDQAVRGRLPLVAVQRRDLPARRPGAEGRRPLPADRSRRHAAIHGRPGARRRQARPAGRPRGGARGVLLRRHRRDDRALPRAERRLSRARRPRRLPQPLRGAGQGALARLRGLSPAGRGARARCWRRRCA